VLLPDLPWLGRMLKQQRLLLLLLLLLAAGHTAA
jgi:hypothetical protein